MLIPVTVFTGFLGAGKTTIIINLIKQLPPGYKMVMLKNEFGNVAVDSKLVAESNIKVTEMLNGCLCCVLVGKMGNALEEIVSKYTPDRIMIETSGSAYPAPIAWEIRKMGSKLKLDGIITVIDAVNFSGYRDRSYTAKLQAQYTDLILINKHEQTTSKALDKLLDDVYELNPSTPKIKTDNGYVDQKLIFGLDSHLFKKLSEVEQEEAEPGHNKEHQHEEVDIIELITQKEFDRKTLDEVLKILPKWDFYRVKGALKVNGNWEILNYAFGTWEYIPLTKEQKRSELVFMGKNFPYHLKHLPKDFELPKTEFKLLD